MSRRALILSGRFGKGHDTVAEATAAALVPLGVESRIVDAIALLGGSKSMLGDKIFRALLSVPPVYDGFHFSQLRTGSRLARLLDRAALHHMYPQFLQEVRRYPPDLIVSVFATGAAAAARYKRDHPEVVTAVFMTDSYAHRLWVHDGTDVFLVTSQLGARSVHGFRPRAKVHVVSAPTRPGFYTAPDQATARAALGVPLDARCVLLMSGAWGIGPVAACARELAHAGFWVLAVAGHNAALEKELRADAATDRRIVPFGFTDRVPELMAASDLVVSSSGDTCREARVVGRGLVLLDVVPGHGRENLIHELELGGAVVSTPEPKVLVAAVETFLAEQDRVTIPPVHDPTAWEHELRSALADASFAGAATPAAGAGIEIRPLPTEDADRAGEIVVEAYAAIPGGWPLEEGGYVEELRDVRRRMDQAVVIGAYLDGVLVGCVTYVQPGSGLDEHGGADPSLRMLGVAPEAAGRGVGTALVRWVIERATADGHRRLCLHTTGPMRVAQHMYEALGFEREPARDWTFAPDRTLLAYAKGLA